MKLRRLLDRTLILYLVIGILNFLFCTALMFVLFNLCGFSEHSAPLVNYGLGSVIWYLACHYLLFPESRTTWQQVLRFLLEVAVCYLLSYYVVSPLLSRVLLRSARFRRFFSFGGGSMNMIEGNCEMAVGALVYALLNYFGQRYFVFTNRFDHFQKSQKNDLTEQEP